MSPHVVPAIPASSTSSTRLAAITPPRCFRTNFRSRYARLGGAATHRLVRQVPEDVGREAVGRLVPPGAVLLQRLHHDPVEVPPQRPLQVLRVDAAAGRDARQGVRRCSPCVLGRGGSTSRTIRSISSSAPA